MKKPSAATNAAAIHPARLSPKAFAKPIGQTHRLQPEQQRNEPPAQRIVAEDQHAHRDEHLAERWVVVVVGDGQRVAVGVLDEGLFVEGEPGRPGNALNTNHHPAHDHRGQKCRNPALCRRHGLPGLAQLRDLAAQDLPHFWAVGMFIGELRSP